MPLVPRDPGTQRVEMEDGDWYELRKELGWYHRNRLSEVNAINLHMAWDTIKDGEIKVPRNERLPVTLEGLPEVQLAKMLAYIKAWSHPEPINENTVKRIPPSHARLLLREIEKLEKQQDGVTDDSPLGEQSSVLLEPLSFKADVKLNSKD